MSVEILVGDIGGKPGAVLVDSVTGVAFGQVLASYEEADDFAAYLYECGYRVPQTIDGVEWTAALREYRRGEVCIDCARRRPCDGGRCDDCREARAELPTCEACSEPAYEVDDHGRCEACADLAADNAHRDAEIARGLR